MTDLLLLTHDPESSTGTTIEWCRDRGVSFASHASQTYFSTGRPRDFGGLILFGGDMETWETEKHPWLLKEKALIREFIRKKRPVFGICLGSQLLAEQLGAKVSPLGFWEFGWFPVKLANGEELMPLHCHSSMFSLPEGAKRIATDRTDTNQVFRTRSNLVGFQFHTEIDERRIEHITSELSDPPEGRVQSKEEILDGFKRHAENLKRWYFSELDAWWSQAMNPKGRSPD